LDHLDDWEVISLPRIPEHRSTRCVAGDDERLDALVDESIEKFQREGAHLGERARPIRGSSSVAEIEDRLIGKLIDHCPGDGEPADPGVEDADRGESGSWHGDKGTRRPSRVIDRSPAGRFLSRFERD
jgi:hypothetical protein